MTVAVDAVDAVVAVVGGACARFPFDELRGKLAPSDGSTVEKMLIALIAISKSFSTLNSKQPG